MVIGQVAVKLHGVFRLALGLGTTAGLQDLIGRELLLRLPCHAVLPANDPA
jgi:hypothetical protein